MTDDSAVNSSVVNLVVNILANVDQNGEDRNNNEQLNEELPEDDQNGDVRNNNEQLNEELPEDDQNGDVRNNNEQLNEELPEDDQNDDRNNNEQLEDEHRQLDDQRENGGGGGANIEPPVPVYSVHNPSPPGVAMGLSCHLQHDVGDLYHIEVDIAEKLSPKEESLIIAESFVGPEAYLAVKRAFRHARSQLQQRGFNNLDFADSNVRIDAVRKAIQGPSCGIAVTSAILSAVMDRSIDSKVAMTGEVTQKGKIMEIGKIRQKLRIAQQIGATRVILPEEIRGEVDQIPDAEKTGLNLDFVSHYNDVFDILFPPL